LATNPSGAFLTPGLQRRVYDSLFFSWIERSNIQVGVELRVADGARPIPVALASASSQKPFAVQ
jgi:hypothetical protein